MSLTKQILRSFAGGEITAELAGRLDLVKYQTGLGLCRNFITLPHGPATRRPGLAYINEAKDSTRKVRLIPFQFNAEQSAVLEFGHQYIRFHIDGGTLLETGKTITAITKANPGVVTSAAHGFKNGDWVYLTGIGGMTQLNGRWAKVANKATDTFQLTDLAGSNINTSSFGTFTSGGTAARAYTLVSPYVEADLLGIKFTQSADVVTLCHPTYAARELRRLAADSWELTAISFAAPNNPPVTVTATPSIADTSSPYNPTDSVYVVTSVAQDGVTESLPSSEASASNVINRQGNYNTISFSPVNGASRYNVYKRRGGAFGYIGQVKVKTGGTTRNISTSSRPNSSRTVTIVTTTAHGFSVNDSVLIQNLHSSYNGLWTILTVPNSTTFTYMSAESGNPNNGSVGLTGTASTAALALIDDNVTADVLKTPPDNIIFLNDGEDAYPSTVTYYEQRRWFAGSNSKPQVIFATRSASESNLTSSLPSQDDDAMEVRIAASQYNRVRHLIALSDLIALTAGGEFKIGADNSQAITPQTIQIKPQGYAGASEVQPVVTSGSIVYVQAQGSRMRELGYNWESNSYRTVEVTIMAPHRFNGYIIEQLAYSRAPDQIVWAVRDDGTLCGMTYVPDQQVYGWHFHDTDGEFESVCVVAEGNEDVMYAVVKRTINSRTVRYIERLRTRIFSEADEAFFVDSGLTYEGSPATVFSGLWHLEGKEVHIVADGAVKPPQTVTNGAVTIDDASSVVHIGLPITADLKTLPLSIERMAAFGQGTAKNVNKVHFRVSQSSVLSAGPSFDKLREYPARQVSDDYDAPPALRNGELTLSIDPSWNQDAAVCVRQSLPLPLTILSMTLEAQTGG